ncbi:MAG: carbamoyltransferase HypF, partial [Candidatus Melainabacteria bacterium]|nr:carbamoyltransferase HypF [Candidatus Melainabacteria bacterium]
MSSETDAPGVNTGRRIRVRGTVQGVGFRPNIYRLANQFGVEGHVLNDGEGVLIEAWAEGSALTAFINAISEQKPPLSHITSIEQTELFDRSFTTPKGFRIAQSQSEYVHTNISPDAATCRDCLAEVRDPFNRRYRYPFTNCTNCGPRLSIIKNIPYDRPFTSMAMFSMCQDCLKEYNDEGDRRFHAQANACHACGPKARLERMDGRVFSIESLTQLDDVDACMTLIKKGEIVAIKGIGGYHLAADATNEQTVARLRQAKKRYHKPFAMMARDLEVIRRYCHVTDNETALLSSWQSPIVLLVLNDGDKLAASLAPSQRSLGFMLPYTALHHLLLMRMDRPIVLTSGNVCDEPQCIDDADARERLGQLADYVLLHDREIVNRLDDSVVRLIGRETQILRRARGYAPEPIELPEGFEKADRILAMGGQLKNTFCLVAGGKAIACQHIGDLEEARAYSDYEHNLALYKNLFAFQAENIVTDLHPDYLSTKLGRRLSAQLNLPIHEVQHHHAHIASVMAENGWPLQGGSLL